MYFTLIIYTPWTYVTCSPGESVDLQHIHSNMTVKYAISISVTPKLDHLQIVQLDRSEVHVCRRLMEYCMVLVTYNKEYKWLGMKLVTPEKLPSHHFTLEHLSNCILEHFVALNVLNGLMHSTSTVSCTSPVVLNCSLSTLSRPATVCLFHITENKSTL